MRSIVVMFAMIILCISLLGCVQTSQEKVNKDEKAKNIILMIGDGMGVSQITAGITANKGQLNLEDFKNIGFSKTQSASDYITDSGAGGTAISIGKKTYDHAIGVDKDTIPHTTILEYAEMNGKATGLVVTSEVTHATPASFIAHQKDRYMYEEIAEDFMKTDIEVFIGGGLKFFNDRKDKRDLTQNLVENSYQLVTNMEDLMAIESGKVAGLLYDKDPPRFSEGRHDMLPVCTQKAIEILNQQEKGFFLLVEGSQIDWGGHDNSTVYIIEEMIDFDNAIGKVLEFAKLDGHTLVIVTADHETGGMALINGNMETGEVDARYTSTNHTGVMVPVFAYGPGSENFRGIYENNELFTKIMNAFGFKK